MARRRTRSPASARPRADRRPRRPAASIRSTRWRQPSARTSAPPISCRRVRIICRNESPACGRPPVGGGVRHRPRGPGALARGGQRSRGRSDRRLTLRDPTLVHQLRPEALRSGRRRRLVEDMARPSCGPTGLPIRSARLSGGRGRRPAYPRPFTQHQRPSVDGRIVDGDQSRRAQLSYNL